VANYQTALRSVTYFNNSENPSGASRTVSWQVSDGAANSNIPTSTINVTPVNDAPVVTAGGTLTYTESDPASVVDNTVTVSDVDSANITGATVQITGNYNGAQDVLSFATIGPISGTFAAGTGTLTLTGTDTVANYQAALRTVKYNNTSTSPSAATRTVTWIATDGVTPSAGATSTINVISINTAPTITAGGTLNYTENQVATAIDNTITVTDPDTPNMVGATVQITGNYANGQDVLGFVTQNGITGNFVAASGTLTLTGSSSVANYQTALRSVTYFNTSDNPSTLARTISWRVDDGDSSNNLSNIATSTVNVAAVNDAPVVVAGGTLNYTENDPATVINNAVTVTDADNTSLTGATVQITANLNNTQDVLSATAQGSVTVNYTAATGLLTLSGTDTLAVYQNVLRSVKYQNTSESPTTLARTITWIATDGTTPSSPVTSTVNVASVNDAPVLTAGATLNYTENQAASIIDNTITVSDADTANMASATVQITGNYANGQDILGFVNQNGISGNFVAASGTLNLTGSSSVANYQTALRSVTYFNNSDAPSTAARTITWTVNDGTTNSNQPTSTVNVAATNDAPVIVAGNTLAYTENQPASDLSPALTLTDVDSPNITGATIQITTNYVNGEDILSFATLGPISGTFTAATGTMTLTGTDTVANYQAALRTVKYNNTSENPSALNRTVTWNATDGALTSANVTSTITVTPVSDPPVLTAGATLNYTENQAATVIDNTVTVSDVDTANMASATVQITGNYANGQDILGFVNQNGITGNFVAASGTLNLTGASSVANYQTALRSVTYFNNSDAPSGLSRTVTWTVNDGTSNSNQPTSTINVTPTNDAPVIVAGNTLAYTENQPASSLSPALTLTDVDSPNITGATIQITTNYVNGEDILSFATLGPISGTFTAATGTMTLTGTDTVANYQAALRTVKYNNTSENPSTLNRTVTWNATDGALTSANVTSTITVASVNDPPAVTAGGALTYTENDVATVIDNSITVADVDNTNMASATVQLTTNYANGQDILGFVNQNGITGNFVAATGTLTLTGSSSTANYQTALRSVTYFNNSDNPSALARTVVWTVNDGTANSNQPTSTINVIPVNDAPVLANAGAGASYTENAAGSVINSVITVTDVDSPNLAGATISITANLQANKDVLNFTNQNGINGSYSGATGILTLTGSSSVANYQTALRSITYSSTSEDPSTLTRTVSFQVDDGAAQFNLSNTISSTVTVTNVNDAPTAAAFAGLPAQAGIPITYPAGKLSGTDNAEEAANGTVVTLVTTPDSVTNGVVTINADGSFTFTPNSSGLPASFNYHVTDNGRPGAGLPSPQATVSFTVAGPPMYFVKSVAVGTGTCTLGNECTLATAINKMATDGPGSTAIGNAVAFISDANTHSPAVTVTLASGQKIVGQGVVAASFDSLFAIGAPAQGTLAARPAVNGTRPTVSGAVPIAMHDNSWLRGFNYNPSGNGMSSTGRTGLIVGDMNIASTSNNVAQFAVNLGTSSGTFNFGTISVTGNGAAVNFSSTTSASTVTFGNISTSGGAAVAVTSSGTTNFTFANVTSTSGQAVNLTTTSTGDFTFTDVTSTTGTAVTVTTSTGDLVFHAINCNGATKGIDLNAATGTFTVNGTSTTAGTGGTIQSISQRGAEITSSNNITLKNMNFTNANTTNGADPTVTPSTCGDIASGSDDNTGCNAAIFLQTVNGVTLNNVTVDTAAQMGINGNGVQNLTMTGSAVKNAGNQVKESGIYIKNLTGTNSISNATFQNDNKWPLRIHNVSGTLNSLLIDNITFTGVGIANVASADGFLFSAAAGSATMTIQNSRFYDHHSYGSQIDTSGAAVTVTFNNNDFGQTTGAAVSLGSSGGVALTMSNGGTLDYTINNNRFYDTDIVPIVLTEAGSSTAGSRISGTISANTIGDNGVANSGAASNGYGIQVNGQGAGTVAANILNNTISQVTNTGINIETMTGASKGVFHIKGNTLNAPAAVPANFAISIWAGNTATDTTNVCAEIGGTVVADKNTINGLWSSNIGIRTRQRFTTTYNVSGYNTGTGTDMMALQNYIAARNTLNNGQAVNSSTTTAFVATGATCAGVSP
jgi:hypothetical protein